MCGSVTTEHEGELSSEEVRCNMLRSVTRACNQVRRNVGQDTLVSNDREADMRGHDQGPFGRALTIFNTTNKIQQMWNQGPLAPSDILCLLIIPFCIVVFAILCLHFQLSSLLHPPTKPTPEALKHHPQPS